MRRSAVLALTLAAFAPDGGARAATVCPQRATPPETYERITATIGGQLVAGFIGPNGRAGKNVVSFVAHPRGTTSLKDYVSRNLLHDP